MNIEGEIASIELQIKNLKARRDSLLSQTTIPTEQLKRILAMRAPQQTLCQMLRDLYAILDEPEREKVGKCLLVAKKMDARLQEHYGVGYAAGWYDAKGDFIR